MAIAQEELPPLTELVLERSVADTQEHSPTMERIRQLVEERYRLYQEMARYPFTNMGLAARVREIDRELDRLWDQERRERAATRARLERSISIAREDDAAGVKRARRAA
jgi:hypothetical protein